MKSPIALYDQATEEHPNDLTARRERYLELMREEGHIVKREPSQEANLPCGWPHK